jgi:peptide/nickel transport system permease protein
MMLTQETPVPVKTARQRINWAKLFWMLRQSRSRSLAASL